MSEFKVGDKVKCIDNCDVEYLLSRNRIYVILGKKGDYVLILCDDKYEHPCLSGRFELVKEEVMDSLFRVGDIVKCIDDSLTARMVHQTGWPGDLTKNRLYEILEYHKNSKTVTIIDNYGYKATFFSNRFELVEKEIFDKEEFAYKIFELWKISANFSSPYEKVLDMLGYTIESKTDYTLVKKIGE